MSSLQAPMELRATVTGSSGRTFTMTVVTSKETWDQASGGALVPLAVREQASALIMQQIIAHARNIGIHERLAWPQVQFYEPLPSAPAAPASQ